MAHAGKGAATRERILDIAEAAVLAKGFAATSIEEIIVEAGITKSGFFYHFRDKNELAREMLARYVQSNDREFDHFFGRGRELSDDPLQAFLIALKLMAESLSGLPGGHPGCIITSICYQERLFDRQVVELTAHYVRRWNERFRGYLAGIEAVHPPREGVDLDELAAMLACVIDGGIIMSKVLAEPGRLESQIMAYRALVRLAFAPAAEAAAPRPALAAE